MQADDVVELRAQPSPDVPGADRDRENNRPRPAIPEHARRCHGGDPRGEAVVDENDESAGDAEDGTARAVGGGSALELASLALDDGLELMAGDAQAPHDFGVDYRSALFAERPEAELGLHRRTEFSNETDVKRSSQRPRNLETDRNPAAR
jgi:hypothetical protein